MHPMWIRVERATLKRMDLMVGAGLGGNMVSLYKQKVAINFIFIF